MTPGKRLKALRKKNNLSMADLANMTGLTSPQISNYENNLSSPTMKALIKLANSLGTTTDFISRGVKNQNLLEGIPAEERKLILDYIKLVKMAIKYRELGQ